MILLAVAQIEKMIREGDKPPTYLRH